MQMFSIKTEATPEETQVAVIVHDTVEELSEYIDVDGAELDPNLLSPDEIDDLEIDIIPDELDPDELYVSYHYDFTEDENGISDPVFHFSAGNIDLATIVHASSRLAIDIAANTVGENDPDGFLELIPVITADFANDMVEIFTGNGLL